jgi:hypothetical protein
VEALLGRYPNLAEAELAELIKLYPSLSILDQAQMTADGQLVAKLAAFDRDHGKKLRSFKRGLLGLFTFPALILVFTMWWLTGGNA